MMKQRISAVRGGGVLFMILTLLFVVQTGSLRADETESLPPAQEIIDRFIEATGGEAAIRKHRSYEIAGQFSMPAAGLTGPLTVYSKAPNMSLVVVEIPGMGTIREGFDGSVGWGIDPAQGPSLKEGKQLDQAKFGADFYQALHAKDRFKTMETVEKIEFNGTSCYKLLLVRDNGDETIQYYDTESHLLVGIEATVETPMGALATTTSLGKYKEIEGVRVPMHMVQSMGPGMEQVLTFTEVKINSVESKVFDIPVEIQGLLEDPVDEE